MFEIPEQDGFISCKYAWSQVFELKIKPRPIVESLNFFPQVWPREIIHQAPHDFLRLTDLWLKSPPPLEVLNDFKKVLKYYIYGALFSVVGKKNKSYPREVHDPIDDFSILDGIRLLTNLFKFGLEPLFEMPEDKQYFLCYRHQESFLSYFEWDSVFLEEELILIVGNVKKEFYFMFLFLDAYIHEETITIFFKNKKHFNVFVEQFPYLIKNRIGNTKDKYDCSLSVRNSEKYLLLEIVKSIYCYKLALKYALMDNKLFSYKKNEFIAKEDLIFEINYYTLIKFIL